MLMNCVMRNLEKQPWRVCLIRHVAAKERFFRGDESYNPCLDCPQIIELEEEMGRKKRERITCMICQKPDMHNFSGGMCRGCYFKQQPGKDEGAQTRKTKTCKTKTCKCGNALADSNKTGLCMSCAIKKSLTEKKSRIESSKKAPANPADLTASGIDEASQQDKKPSSFEKTEPAEVCDHDIGTLTTQGNPLYPSSTQVIQKYKGYEHREGDKFRLFKFCPECGAKLNIEAKTTAVKFLTIFYEVENQEKVNA